MACAERRRLNHTPAKVSESIMPNLVHHNEMDRAVVCCRCWMRTLRRRCSRWTECMLVQQCGREGALLCASTHGC